MKKFKKFPTMFGVAAALMFGILPLGAWTTADVEEPVEMTKATVEAKPGSDYGIEPYYGGENSQNFVFSTDHNGDGKGDQVTVKLYADNWIWPAIDQAIIKITSDSPQAHYGLVLNFVWTKKMLRLLGATPPTLILRIETHSKK